MTEQATKRHKTEVVIPSLSLNCLENVGSLLDPWLSVADQSDDVNAEIQTIGYSSEASDWVRMLTARPVTTGLWAWLVLSWAAMLVLGILVGSTL